MRPLICPQCGGQITEYREGATFTTCEYCATRFLIEENKVRRRPPQPVEAPELSTSGDLPPFVRVLGISMGLIAVVGVIGLLMFAGGRKTPSSSGTSYSPPLFRKPDTPTPVATATPDKPLMQFGGTGENPGEFSDASAIAVDSHGAIYVGDNKLRVQQFDAKGEFVREVHVPSKGRNYERARTIDKLAVGSDGKLYVAAGGVILVYGSEWKSPQRVIHVAPDYIQDFALKSDGSMLAVSDDDHIETLLFINKAGGVTKKIRGFHTDAIESRMSPLETAVESVRIAIGGDGSIYSLYALGSLGSFSLNIGDGDLRIAKFSSTGRFEKAFTGSVDSRSIFIDKAGRVILSDNTSVRAYGEDGTVAASIQPVSSLTDFTTDGLGNIYTLADNTVALWSLQE